MSLFTKAKILIGMISMISSCGSGISWAAGSQMYAAGAVVRVAQAYMSLSDVSGVDHDSGFSNNDHDDRSYGISQGSSPGSGHGSRRDEAVRVYARKKQEPAADVVKENLEASAAEEKKIIVLDPGHTAVMSGLYEPIGPGSSQMKEADTMGTRGVASGVTEYELNLVVAGKLQAELERRGYVVLLTRQSHDLSLSCVERAAVANNANADVFVRIHADGSSDQSARGALTICITPNNPYCPELYEASRRLSDCVLEEYCRVTSAYRRGVWETDTMTGNNWSQVPVTLIELGFMTNPEEDLLMETEEYQDKMVTGIADGIDRYLQTP